MREDKLMELLKKLEGLHTIETVMGALGMKRQSCLNLLSKLKKEGYVRTQGGNRHKRWYWISMRKQLPRSQGMFDVLNECNKNFKLMEWYDHQVHGKYTAEDAIVDAVKTKKLRVLLAALKLFNRVSDWKRLYSLSMENGCWQQVGALYDVARQKMRVKRMQERYAKPRQWKEWKPLGELHNRNNFPAIQQKWHVYIPFNEHDVSEVV